MKVKTYYGANIRQALEKARRELGPEAAIVASRQAGPDEGLSGSCEVVCGVPDGAADHKAEAAPQPPALASPPAERFSRLRKPISAVRKVLSGAGPTSLEVGGVRTALLSDGFGDDLTSEILAGVVQRHRAAAPAAPADSLAAELLLRRELAGRLRVAPGLGRSTAARKLVAFVGPPGGGKTTSLVKIAARYGLAARRRPHIISTDSYRIGGTDLLRTCAAAMAVSFESIESADGLASALERHTDKNLILIDTPGFAPADLSSSAQLAALLSRHAEVDVHLVLPACMSAGNLAAVASRFRPFLPSKLLITAVDATVSCRTVVAQSLLTDTPISFLGTGQVIPDDLEEATAERLVGSFAAAAKKAVPAA